MNADIAVITGASSGMGRACARELAQAPHRFGPIRELWLVGRSLSRLEETVREAKGPKSPEIRCLEADLADPASRQRLEETLKAEMPRIRFLACAAGMGVIGKVAELPLKPQLDTIAINCLGLTYTVGACLPFCVSGCRILLFSSAAAFLPQPGFSVYAASKAYVLSFSRSLRQELAPRGIGVTAVCPGPVDTAFFQGAERYRKRSSAKNAFMARPGDVVRKSLRDAEKNRALSVYGLSMKAARLACRILPQGLLLRLLGEMDKEKRHI